MINLIMISLFLLPFNYCCKMWCHNYFCLEVTFISTLFLQDMENGFFLNANDQVTNLKYRYFLKFCIIALAIRTMKKSGFLGKLWHKYVQMCGKADSKMIS